VEGGLEELTRDAERQRALELVPTCGECGHPALRSDAARALEQRGLPEPGRALDHHDRAVSGGGRFYVGPDPLQLGLTLDKQRGTAPHVLWRNCQCSPRRAYVTTRR
jgi:hypothetical protein